MSAPREAGHSERMVPLEQHEHALSILTGLKGEDILAHVIVVLRTDGSPSISSDTTTTEQAIALLAFGLHAHTASAVMGGETGATS